MCSRCVFTVDSLMNSLAAASRLFAPPAISRNTSSSRSLSESCAGWRTCPSRRRATDGESTASPWKAAHRTHQFLPRRIFEQVPNCAGLNGGEHIVVGVVGRQDQPTHPTRTFPPPPDGPPPPPFRPSHLPTPPPPPPPSPPPAPFPP